MTGHTLIMRTLLIAILLFLGACASGGPESYGASLVHQDGSMDAHYAGKSIPLKRGTLDNGLLIPDGAGGMILLPGSDRTVDQGYVDARELKLRIRELGEQLVAGIRDCSLQGTVAMPAAFVDLGHFDRTSALGRLIAEQLYHELHQRGYAVREYRMPGSIKLRKGEGEFALSRELGRVATKASSTVAVVGTYQYDKDAVFVNARLVRPRDGMVLRTANIILRNNELTRRMARSGGSGARLKQLTGKGMHIRDFDAAMRPPAPAFPLSPFDRGEDVH